ncbi:hypothetical protein ACG9XS_16085 [Acinetobacter gyllenbergii]|uniref:hypothetical protein n=1 Tax=Acinetobacter gyllenbergii TaxID=134534 RepID=UPI003AF667CF
MAGQIVLKSQNAINDISELPDISYYINRVIEDGGVIYDMSKLLEVFQFIYEKNINDSEVFSAVNPAWGIKYDLASGNVSKLYSLFDPAGDLTVTAVTFQVKLNNDLPVPTIYLGGSMNTYLKSLGVIADVENFGMATAYSVPVLQSYGGNQSFAIGLLYSKSEHDAHDPNGPSSPYIAATSVLSRPDSNNTNLPSWTNFFGSYGATGSVGSNVVTGYENAKPLSCYGDANSLMAFRNGSLVTSDNTVTQLPTQKKNLGYWFGSSVTPTGQQAASYFLGHLIENWVLVNTTSQKMAEVSKRINDKYYAVIPH